MGLQRGRVELNTVTMVVDAVRSLTAVIRPVRSSLTHVK
jgi:hypothetical protein